MEVFKVPANEIENVSGEWGVHKIQPRVSLHGWAILSLPVGANTSIPDTIRSKILSFEKIEYNPADFPQPTNEDLGIE